MTHPYPARGYRRALPGLGLSVERATNAVPDDGQFHVVRAGEIVFSSKSERRALAKYAELRDLLRPAAPQVLPVHDRDEMLLRERLEHDLNALHGEASQQKRSKALRKGGKGGSGGVAR